MKRSLPLQNANLSAGIVAQEFEVRAEQAEEVLPLPALYVPLQCRPGCSEVGPIAVLALEDVIATELLLVSPDLGDERIGDAVQDNVWIDIARLGRERPCGKTDDRPGLIKRVPGSFDDV